jgi:hypothetical protein
MRCWGIASIVALGVVPAAAQPVGGVTTGAAGVEAEPAPLELGYGALPGGLRAPSARTLPAGAFAIGAVGGYGFRSALLSEDHQMTRGTGDIGFGFGITDSISIALSFDGRYDKHTGVAPEGDDGYVGDPHVLVRAGKRVGSLTAGAQVGVWVPGKDAPSIAADAVSFDVRGLLSIKAGPGTASVSAGFRVDNSDKSVENPALLSAEDRVSLGVSQFHAVLAGAHYALPLGKVFVGFEASGDIFVGGDAPSPIIRGGMSVGRHLAQWQLFAYARGATGPSIDPIEAMAGTFPLVPYEPSFTAGVGVAGTFGGKQAKARTDLVDTAPRTIEVELTADLSGKVVDDTGTPVAGATVTVKLKSKTGTAVSDDKGEWKLAKVPIGKLVDKVVTVDESAAEITCEVAGKKPKTSTLVLVQGVNELGPCTLDPLLPPTTLKAVVRAYGSGKPLVGATIKLEPGGLSGITDADGLVSIDNVERGTYQVTASMTGFKDQTLAVTFESEVVVKNFELRK